MVSNVSGIAPGIRTQDLQSRVNVKGGSFRSHLDAASARRARDVFVSTRTSAQGAGGLSGEKILELAKKYDPEQMTQEEYVSFIDDLVEEGVLSDSDKNIIGYGGPIVIGQGDMHWGGGMVYNGPLGSEKYDSLSDASGDVLKWARQTSSWVVINGGQYPDKFTEAVKIREFKKMVPVLEAMYNARHS